MIFNYQNFDEVFNFDPECSYDEIAVQRATAHRQALEGLFFDRVLKLLGIKRRVYLPPNGVTGRELTILSCQILPTEN